MKSISYHGIKEQGFISKVTLRKPEEAASYADHFGFVAMTGSKKGVLLTWGEVALRVVGAAKVSPELKADLLRALTEA